VDVNTGKCWITTERRYYIHVNVQWHWTCDQYVVGSIPTGEKLRNNLGHVVYTYVPLSPSSITWYWSKDGNVFRLGRSLWQKVITAYCYVWTDCLYTGISSGPTLGNEYGITLLYLHL